MAAIGNIRKHYGLLVVIVGIALLAFVLGDLFKSTNSRQTTNVATVDGKKITYQDYSNLVNMNLENVKAQNGGSLSTEDNYSVHANTLEQMIREIIMENEYEDLGLVVSGDELYDQFLGENPNQYVVQSFTNPDGSFNRELVTTYIRDFQTLNPELKSNWLNFERAIKEDRLNTKYETLLKKGFYLPNKLAERIYADKNDKTSAEVYAVRYNTVADSTVVVNDADNKAFYNNNKNKYQTEATRSIDYVVFDITPSKADVDYSKKYVSDLKKDFTEIDNAANFVNANSDLAYDSTWKSRKDVPAELEQVIFDQNNGVGFVYGPYENEGYYNIAKIVAMENRSDSLMASHILVSYANALRSDATRTKEEAKALADSILNVVKKDNSKLETLAKDFSDDPSAQTNNGDLGWFTDGMMVHNFNEFVQDNKVGTIGMVETPFGYHIIKVTDRKEAAPKARLAVLAHEITPSSATYQNVFAEANKFVTENTTAEDFNKAIEEQGLNKRTYPSLRKNTNFITGISNPRQIVRWAFDENTKVGDMSTIFDLDNMYVVAVLTKSVEEGFTPYEEIADRYQFVIKKEKKGAMLAEQAKTYGTDYQKMIDNMKGEKTTVDNVTFEGRGFGNFGVEDKVIGTVIGMKEGEVSEPIVGGNGLFVVKVTKETPAAATTDYSSIVREYRTRFNNQILNNSAYSALKDNVKIEDNSILFY
ncbi:MAG: peptidylprolyl isomerase [Bacteroidales bacterium]|nr:peptidylprolyl isomerase [Bacteroidales bacterium]